MLLNLSHAPKNASFLTKLRDSEPHLKRTKMLLALEDTLNYFRIGDERDTMAETLLRMHAVYGEGRLPGSKDARLATLLQIYRHFRKRYNT